MYGSRINIYNLLCIYNWYVGVFFFEQNPVEADVWNFLQFYVEDTWLIACLNLLIQFTSKQGSGQKWLVVRTYSSVTLGNFC